MVKIESTYFQFDCFQSIFETGSGPVRVLTATVPVLDPTIRYELRHDSGKMHADRVDDEKKAHYNSTLPFFRDKYGLSKVYVGEVIGFVGSRETIPAFFENSRRRFCLKRGLCCHFLRIRVSSQMTIFITMNLDKCLCWEYQQFSGLQTCSSGC